MVLAGIVVGVVTMVVILGIVVASAIYVIKTPEDNSSIQSRPTLTTYSYYPIIY